jgi:hypothetical protein
MSADSKPTAGNLGRYREAQAGRYQSRLPSGRMEGVDLGAVLGRECRMLLHAVRVKAVNPENREIHTIADAIGPVVLGSCMTRRTPSAPRAAS